MTLEEAQRLIAAHLEAHGGRPVGLNPDGVAGALVEGEQLLFEYREATKTLRTAAFVYRWRGWPAPGLLEALHEEAGRGATGGGSLEYAPERKTLSLVREYSAPPPAQRFEQEQAALRAACTRWREELFARVAERAVALNSAPTPR